MYIIKKSLKLVRLHRKKGKINMKILVVEPNKRPYVKDVDGSDDALREIIGGDLEISVPFINDMNVHLVCEEYGKINGRPLNRHLKTNRGKVNDIIAGTFCLYNTSEEGDMIDLTDKQIRTYKQKFDEINPALIWFNHQHYFPEQKIRVIIFEPSKEPYAKEMVLNSKDVEEIVGAHYDMCCHSDGKNDFVQFRKENKERKRILSKFFETPKDFGCALELYEQYRDTYIACKPSTDGFGFESFNDEEMEEYIGLVGTDEMAEVMHLAK